MIFIRISSLIGSMNMEITTLSTEHMKPTTASAAPATARLSARADDGPRTRDLKLGKLALYQLSYVRVDRAV